jgi:hypothetical protein
MSARRVVRRGSDAERLICWCGCRSPVTHRGVRDGVVLTWGCRFIVGLWARDPAEALRRAS